MNAKTKSALILVLTLVLGSVVGAIVMGAVIDQRMEKLRGLRTQRGFGEMMEEVIGVSDAAQEAQVRPILEGTLEQLRTSYRAWRSERAAIMDTMRQQLVPVLDSTQQRHLQEWFDRSGRYHDRDRNRNHSHDRDDGSSGRRR